MKYNISTTLIWDNYKIDCECPLCEILRDIESKIVMQFQGEAVMLNDFRERVNLNGFCKEHFNLLYKQENKLGTALQTSTRLVRLNDALKKPSNYKDALKQAEMVKGKLSTCVMCDLINHSMDRYYKTVAKMFVAEEEFKGLLLNGKGHCLYHYGKLLENSDNAKGKASEYLNDLYSVQKNAMGRMYDEIRWFCDKFDYRNSDKPMGTSHDALPRCIKKIHGD